MDSSGTYDSLERTGSAVCQMFWPRKEGETGVQRPDRVRVPAHPDDPQDDGPGDSGADTREPVPAILSGIESVHDEAHYRQQFIGSVSKAIKPGRLASAQ